VAVTDRLPERPRRLTPPGALDTRLGGGWLALARVAWVAMACLALLLFVLGIPVRYDHLLNLRGDDALGQGWTPAAIRRALAQLGLSTDFRAVYSLVGAIVVAVGAVVVAFVIYWRKSDDWLALFVSLFLLTLGLWPTGVMAALVASNPVWWLPNQAVAVFALIGFLPFCLLFPDGRFVPRWSWVVALVWSLLVLAGSMFSLIISPNQWLGQFLLMAGYGAGVVAQVYRYRRVSGPVQRQQTKWVVIGVAGLVPVFLLFVGLLPALVPALYQPSPLGMLFEMVGTTVLFGAFLLLPLAVGIAVLRYQLWALDLLIHRTLIYGSLTGILVAVYVGLILLLQQGFRTLTGQDSPFAVVASTLLIVGLFQPLRSRLQKIIDRRFYRSKYDAQKTLAAFGASLRQEVSLTELHARLLTVVEKTMQPSHVSLWLRPPERPTQPRLHEEQRDTLQGGLR
jgi:hypothetical protein